MGSKCSRCNQRNTCWAAPYCKGTCDTCDCPFDWNMRCGECKNLKCEKRGSRPSAVKEWKMIPKDR